MKFKKNILLDFGGVLIDLDAYTMEKSFESLRVNEAPEASKLHQFETGKIDLDAFYALWKRPKWVSNNDIKKAWNSMVLEVPEERIVLLQKLKKEHNLYLVSNTNAIHIDDIKKKMGPFGWKKFSSLFEGMFFSYEMKQRKPDAGFFKKVLKDAGLKPEDCTFIDDTKEHVHAAKKLGMDTHWLNLEEETILDLGKAQ